MNPGIFSRIRLTPTARIAVLGALVIVLPAVFFGPWLPFVDLASFVGLDSYPPKLSYGPLHYYVFQFTYIGQYALSRLLVDLHVSVPIQILGIYCLEAGACFAVIYRSLQRLVEDEWTRCLGIALGTLAFWDGLFLGGGPLSYSLAAMCVTVATFLTLREAAEPGGSSGGLIALLGFAALLCHPFALPFVLVLGALRFVFVARHRIPSAGLLAAWLLSGWVIASESPAGESAGGSRLMDLFGLGGSQFVDRLTGLFTQDIRSVHFLFGFVPFGLEAYLIALGIIHLGGFLMSPVVACLAKESKWLRGLAALNMVVALLYLLSRDSPTALISQWPQRILTFYSPVTFLAGFACPVYLLARFRRGLAANETDAASRRVAATKRGVDTASTFLIPSVAILVLLVLVQIPILRLGREIPRNLDRVRSSILKTSAANAYVVAANVDAIRPFYLRCVPFLLFSDPEIVARNLLIHTEWHFLARHPTRLAEDWLDLGRARYAANFWTGDDGINVQLVRQPADRFPVTLGTNEHQGGNRSSLALAQFNQGLDLADAGDFRDALEHFESAAELQPNFTKARNNMGAVLYSMGRKAEAIKQWEAAAAQGDTDARSNLNLVR